MELNTESNQAACCDAPGNLLHSMKGTKLDDESSHCAYGKQELSQDSTVPEKVDSNLVPINLDTQAVNVLNGEYCGLYTQLSIDYVDIFEILKEEILAAEERELEVNGLLNAGKEELEESPRVEGLDGTFVRDSEVTDIDRDHCQGDVQNCSFHNKATDVGYTALMHGFLQKGEDGQAELPRSPSAGLLEDTVLKEVEGMGAENYDAAPLEDKGAGLEDRLKPAEVRETGLAQDHQVAEEVEHIESSTTTEGGLARDYKVAEEVEHVESSTTSREGGVTQDHEVAEEVEHMESTTPREGGIVQAQQNDDKADHEETWTPLNVEVNGDTFSKEDEGAGTDKGKETLLYSSRGDDGDHLLQNDMSADKLSEHSEDDEYTSSPFSGPIAFSGMLSYSGMISYSGQIPYSGNISLHSDSSTSTRSFAFPILASDWNSSPAKIGQPDSRYFRRRRRWRPRFCCRRPTTLFD